MSTLQCCCCSLLVQANDPYGHPIAGAEVWLFWKPETKGAFLDPDADSESQGPYTTDASGRVEFTVDDPGNGIYVVRITKAGFPTQYKFVWACDFTCTDPRLGTGHSYFFGNPLIPTGVSITTNVQTSPLIDGGYTGTGLTILDGTSAAIISGTFSGAYPPSYTGGVFPILPPSSVSGCVPPGNGNPGIISVGCVSGGAGIAVNAHIGYMVCPRPTDPPLAVETPTHYCGITTLNGPSTLRGKVTGIEYDPFRVTGSWDEGTWSNGAFGVWLLSTPPPGLVPLTGTFTIE